MIIRSNNVIQLKTFSEARAKVFYEELNDLLAARED